MLHVVQSQCIGLPDFMNDHGVTEIQLAEWISILHHFPIYHEPAGLLKWKDASLLSKEDRQPNARNPLDAQDSIYLTNLSHYVLHKKKVWQCC